MISYKLDKYWIVIILPLYLIKKKPKTFISINVASLTVVDKHSALSVWEQDGATVLPSSSWPLNLFLPCIKCSCEQKPIKIIIRSIGQIIQFTAAPQSLWGVLELCHLKTIVCDGINCMLTLWKVVPLLDCSAEKGSVCRALVGNGELRNTEVPGEVRCAQACVSSRKAVNEMCHVSKGNYFFGA